MNQTGILDLCIYDLFHITTFLDALSKYNLSRTCRYLEYIMNMPPVWKQSYEIEANSLSSKEEVTYIMERMSKKTRKVLFRGKLKEVRYLPANFFTKFRIFDNITVLALERIPFDQITTDFSGVCNRLGIKHFPPTLKELSLKGTTSVVNRHFLTSPEGKPSLRVLILDECHWLNNYHLKCLITHPNLEIISLVGCLPQEPLLLSCLFKVAWHLKIIDVRLANVDDGILSTNLNVRHIEIFPLKSLQCVYLEDSVLIHQGSRVLRLCAAILSQTVNLTSASQSSLYVDPIQDCNCEPSNQLLVPTDNVGRAKMKLSLRNFCFVDFKCISTVNLDVLDLSETRTGIYSIIGLKYTHPNCRIIQPNICGCLVTTEDLYVEPPKGYTCHHINTSDEEAYMNWLYDSLVTIVPYTM